MIARTPASPRQVERFVAAPGGLCNNSLAVLLRMRGPLDKAALAHALHDLVGRHEALRTTLAVSTTGVDQLIWEATPDLIDEEIQLRGPRSRLAALEEQIVAFLNEDVQLNGGPLRSIRLFDLGPDDHALAIRLHHAVVDGVSTGILRSELPLLYEAHVCGRAPTLARPSQMRDFITAQKTLATPRARRFWAEQLRLRPSRSAQLFDRPSDEPRECVDRHLTPLDPPSVAALEEVARSERATQPVAVMAALAACFVGSGDDDLVLGVVFSNRLDAEFATVVGCLMEVVPVRVDLTGGPSLRELVRRTQRAWFSALAHQLPLHEIIDAVGFDRVSSPEPLFDVAFNYHPWRENRGLVRVIEDSAGRALEISVLRMALDGVSSRAARRSMISSWDFVVAEDGRGSLLPCITFQEGTASEERIAAFDAAFRRVLARAVTDSDRSMADR